MMTQMVYVLHFVANSFVHMWPYLLITIPISVAIRMSGAIQYIDIIFKKTPIVSILLTTIVGAFSPFCSCGVIPVIAALLIGGVPLAPVMSFWIASPSMDPEMFFLSVAMLGWNLALWRLVSTFLLSLCAGYLTHFFVIKGWMGNDYVRIGDVRAMAVKDKKCCLTKPFAKQLCEEIMSSTSLVLKFMLLAFFLEALIILYIPQTWIMTLLGKQNALSVLWAAILGVPIYTSNTTALPMIGGLLNQGMNPAAALAFLISGPTTTIPAMAAVWGLVTKKVFFLYLSFVFCGAIFFGYLFQLINKFLVFV